MSVLVVPPLDDTPWPTLGPGIVEWMTSHLVFGPGDLHGQDYVVDDEKVGLLYRMYEVYPKGHPQEGRRRFRRAGISLRKGSSKTEAGAAICAVELAPDGPVRCDGFRRVGRRWEPVGRPMVDPYIPMLAYTEEQSDELAYAALVVMLGEGPFASDYDLGKQWVTRRNGDGKAASLATAPDARDGARTTFQLFDESHRLVLPRHKEAHRTMLANLPKRKIADPWSLEVTTSPQPGEGSVAEGTMEYAKLVAQGKKSNTSLFFFHRQATEGKHDLNTRAGVRAAVLEASGPLAEWSDIDAIVDQWEDPSVDRSYLARVWLNMLIKATSQAFDVEAYRRCAQPEHIVPAKAMITLGLDGSLVDDWTALIATEVSTGFQWPLGIWDPREEPSGQIDKMKVSVEVDRAFKEYTVWRFYMDPPYWKDELAEWQGKYGDKVVLPWYTYRNRQMAHAVMGFDTAIRTGAAMHDGDQRMISHIGNCRRKDLDETGDDSQRLWTVQKESEHSPFKIDGAVAAILSREARNDAIAKAATVERQPSALNTGDVWMVKM